MSEIQRFRFEKTITAGCLTWEFLNEATDGEWVRYIDHRAEVERVIADVVKLRIDLNSVQVEASQLRGEAERLKAQVAALTVAVEQADEAKADAEAAAAREEAETDRVMVERDAAQAEVERLKAQGLDRRRATNQRIIAERDAAKAEVERLKRMLPPTTHTGLRNGPGEGSWSVFAGTVVEERDEAREEVERLNAEVKRLTAERDEARDERDAVQRERERLQALLWLRGRDLPTLQRDQPAQNLDMVANCKETLTSSRPTDEDIWREAFMSQLHDRYWAASEVADFALAEYRKRWPR